MTKSEKSQMLSARGGVCEGCSNSLKEEDAKAHHIQRHADGGPTTKQNTAMLCEDCYKKIHK